MLILLGRWDDAFWSKPVSEVLPNDAALFQDIAACGSFAAYLQTYTPCKRIHHPTSLRELQSDRTRFDWRRFGGITLCHFPIDIPWVICNLSKCEYVRMPIIMNRKSRERLFTGDDTQDISTVFAHRTSMPSYVGASIIERAVVCSAAKGQWAGDRFKICTLEAVSTGTSPTSRMSQASP